MKLSQAKVLYMDYISSYQQASTIRVKQYHFQDLYDARGDINIQDITVLSYIALCNTLHNRNYNTRTSNNRLTTLRHFLKTMQVDFDMEVMDYRKVKYSKEERPLPRAIDPQDITKMINYRQGTEINHLRNKMMIMLLFCTGIRREELRSIKRQDIDLNKKSITIHWKNKKQRLVYLNGISYSTMIHYLSIIDTPSDYIFYCLAENMKYHQLNSGTISKIILKTARLCHVKASAHVLRHTFATTLIKSWVAISTVKEMMWHSDISTTMRYIKVDNTDMINASKMIRI